MYSASRIADWFLARAARDGDSLTQMKLQKLVYIAHGWHLGLFGEPLIDEQVEAWRWGPVIRSLYREYANSGATAIECDPIPDTTEQLDARTASLLEAVWMQYRRYTAAQLSAMTHQKNTPWDETYCHDCPRPTTIPNELIAAHYRRLAGDP